jgi:hypothetical protein
MMMSYYQQAELAHLEHEARLQEAEQARRIAHLQPQHTLNLSAWVGRLWAQGSEWFSQPQPAHTDRITAIRHQPS